MEEENWEDALGKSVAVFLNGNAIADRDVRGVRIRDDSFVLAFNAHSESAEFTLPQEDYGTAWAVVVDSSTGTSVRRHPVDAPPTFGCCSRTGAHEDSSRP